jgi:hypothetical protein
MLVHSSMVFALLLRALQSSAAKNKNYLMKFQCFCNQLTSGPHGIGAALKILISNLNPKNLVTFDQLTLTMKSWMQPVTIAGTIPQFFSPS